MTRRTLSVGRLFGVVAALCGIGGLSCSDSDVAWETSADAVGAVESDRSYADEMWSLSRDEAVEALDSMKRVLEGARGEAAVVDKGEIDGLTQRIDGLRGELVAELDSPGEGAFAARSGLESRFKALRSDVDAFLTRIGHSPDDMANWQDAD